MVFDPRLSLLTPPKLIQPGDQEPKERGIGQGPEGRSPSRRCDLEPREERRRLLCDRFAYSITSESICETQQQEFSANCRRAQRSIGWHSQHNTGLQNSASRNNTCLSFLRSVQASRRRLLLWAGPSAARCSAGPRWRAWNPRAPSLCSLISQEASPSAFTGRHEGSREPEGASPASRGLPSACSPCSCSGRCLWPKHVAESVGRSHPRAWLLETFLQPPVTNYPRCDLSTVNQESTSLPSNEMGRRLKWYLSHVINLISNRTSVTVIYERRCVGSKAIKISNLNTMI